MNTRAVPAPVDGMAVDSLAEIVDELGGLFQAPLGQDSLARLCSPEGLQWLREAGALVRAGAHADAMCALLQTTCRQAAPLARAYSLLFCGPGGPATAAPYESAYVGSGRLFQQPVDDMRRLLGELGLALDAQCREPADHLSIELAALAILLRQRALPRALALAARLGAWTPAFAQAVGRADPEGFYAHAARVLLAALAAIESQLSPVTTAGRKAGDLSVDTSFRTYSHDNAA